MKRLTWLAVLGWIMLSAAEPMLAQESAPESEAAQEQTSGTRPADGVPDARDGMSQPFGRSFMNRWGGGPGAELSEADWDAASQFMNEHSPNRWTLFQRLPDSNPRRNLVVGMILARYRNLISTKEEDSALYELRVKQLILEDSIWGLLREMRSSESTDQRREELKGELRQKVAESVDTWIKERQRRLARLEDTLKQERARLESDLNRLDLMIENRLQRELERVNDFGGMGFSRGMGGRRGRGGP